MFLITSIGRAKTEKPKGVESGLNRERGRALTRTGVNPHEPTRTAASKITSRTARRRFRIHRGKEPPNDALNVTRGGGFLKAHFRGILEGRAFRSCWQGRSRCDSPARIRRAVASWGWASPRSLRRRTRRLSSHRDESHHRRLVNAPFGGKSGSRKRGTGPGILVWGRV